MISLKHIFNTRSSNIRDIIDIPNISGYHSQYLLCIVIKSYYKDNLLDEESRNIVENTNFLSIILKNSFIQKCIESFKRDIYDIIDKYIKLNRDELNKIPIDDNIPFYEFKKIQEYKKVSFIEKGGFSNVFKVLKDGKLYAMKELLVKNYSEITFLAEVKSLSLLNSEYVVKFFDSFIYDNRRYIILEYLNNFNTLSEIFSKVDIDNISEEELQKLRILTDKLYIGLSYIHSKGIVHRDIKSDNILVNIDTLELKYIDFGFSCDESNIFTGNVGVESQMDPVLERPYTIYNLQKADIWMLGSMIVKILEHESLFNMFSDEITNLEEEDDSFYSRILNDFIKQNRINHEDKYSDSTIQRLFKAHFDINNDEIKFADYPDIFKHVEKLNPKIVLSKILSRNIHERTLE